MAPQLVPLYTLVLSNSRCVRGEWGIPCNPSETKLFWHHKPLWFPWAGRVTVEPIGLARWGCCWRCSYTVVSSLPGCTLVLSYQGDVHSETRFCKDTHWPWVISKHAELIGRILIKDFEGGLITIHYTVNCPQAIVKNAGVSGPIILWFILPCCEKQTLNQTTFIIGQTTKSLLVFPTFHPCYMNSYGLHISVNWQESMK